LLKQHGAIYTPSKKGTTVLHVAAKKGYIDILKYLLHESKNQKIHVDSRKKNGMTASMLAVQNNHLFILRMLKEAGANLQITLPNNKKDDLPNDPTLSNVNLFYVAA